MATTGRVLPAGWTVIVTAALPVSPPESVTEAVTVWVPGVRLFEKLPPVPSALSRLEVHASLAVRLPSCVSVAEPVKGIAVPVV